MADAKKVKTTALAFRKLGDRKAVAAILTLNRPDAANAFNDEMIKEITGRLAEVAAHDDCRVLVLRGAGKNFCAGADIHWMGASAKLSRKDNLAGAKKLQKMFERLVGLNMPTIAVAHGAVFGGGVGLVAACDFAIAVAGARFCLSEVRVGIIPAVILPYVARKMRAGQLQRHALSGKVISSDEARAFGLVELCCAPGELSDVLRRELELLLGASPGAQAHFKTLWRELQDDAWAQSTATVKAIAAVRTSKEGQAGLTAYVGKKTPPWVVALDADWKLDGP